MRSLVWLIFYCCSLQWFATAEPLPQESTGQVKGSHLRRPQGGGHYKNNPHRPLLSPNTPEEGELVRLDASQRKYQRRVGRPTNNSTASSSSAPRDGSSSSFTRGDDGTIIYKYTSPITPIAGRDLLPKLLNYSNNFVAMAEVGVQAGIYSEQILRKWPNCSLYYMVDIWQEQKHYDDRANVNNSAQEALYQAALQRVSPYKSVNILRMYSLEAAKKLTDVFTVEETGKLVPSLNVVYLDARHDYCGCLEDIIAWWPLLAENGILCGHDFRWNYDAEWNMCSNGTVIPGGVRAAVMDWAKANDLQVTTTQRDRYETWMIRKPVNIRVKATTTVDPVSGEKKTLTEIIDKKKLRMIRENNFNIFPLERVLMQKIQTLSYAKPIPMIVTKFEIGSYFESEEPNFKTFAQVGFGGGNFLVNLLRRWSRLEHMYIISSYRLNTQWDANPNDARSLEVDKGRMTAYNRLVDSVRWFNNTGKIEVQAKTGKEAIKDFIARSASRRVVAPFIDVVYLDDEKDYCNGLRDISQWWPFIKPNGLLVGSTFHWNDKIIRECMISQSVVDILMEDSQRDPLTPPKDTYDLLVQDKANQIAAQSRLKDTVGGLRTALLDWAKTFDYQVVVATNMDRPFNTWMVRKPILLI